MAHQATNVQGGGDSAETFTRELRLAFESKESNSKLEKIQRLLPKYFDPSFPREEMDKNFKPPTFWAARNGLVEALTELVEKYHCELNYVDAKTGQDLLYTACAKGHIGTVQYLAVEHHFDPSKPSKDKMTPLFAACLKGKVDMVKLLIEKLKCDPTAQDPEGDSLVHAACKNGHLELSQYLIHQHKLSPESCNHKKETPLHLASANGHLPVVHYLVHELHCKTSVFDSNGLSPLHNACRNGRVKVVSCILVVLNDGDASPFDNTGCNPLHLACRSGRSEVVRVLLASGKVDPNALTVLDQAPIEIAHDDKTIKELIKWGAKPVGKTRTVLIQYKMREPLHSLVHIYVIGYEFSGKTTLVKSLQQPNNKKAKILQFAGISSSRVVDVIHRTTGIVPIEYNSPDFGNVLLFDFAGQHQFHASHEALLEYCNTSTAPIFLLVVNMDEDFEEVKRKTNYWVSFIMRNPVSGTSRPHVIVVASHVDQLQKKVANAKEVLAALEKHARRKLEKANLSCKGFFTLDCRDPLKQDALRQCLSTSCQVLRTNEEVDVCCHVLRVFLIDKFGGDLCCKIKDVISKAKVSDYPLPIQADRLCELAETMTTRTKTLFLRNHYKMEESWIVLDIDTLLQKVTGSIFAPESFENKLSTSLQGVLKKSQLRKYFPNLDPDMLVAFLRRLDYCQIVSDKEVLEGINDEEGDDVEPDAPNHPGSATDDGTTVLGTSWLTDLYTVPKHSNITTEQSPTPPVSVSPMNHSFEGSWRVESCESHTSSQQRTQNESPAGNREMKMSNGTLPSAESQQEHPNHESHKPSAQPFMSRQGTVYSQHESPSPTPSQQYIGLRHGSEDSLLFFPGLIKREKPDNRLWIPDESFKFYTGWCLECANYDHTFGQRFLTTLHLRLESRFAMRLSQGTGSQCTIWKNGIHWLDVDGIETIVEMVDDGKAVVLLMRIKEGLETLVKGLRLRSKVIRKILETKHQYCSKVATIEYLIDQSHLRTDHEYPVIDLPLRELKRYNVEIIAQVFLRKSPYVMGKSKNELVPVKDVVLFDPYMGLGIETIAKIYAEDKQEQILEDELLLELAKCHRDNAEHLSMMLLEPRDMIASDNNPNQCVNVLVRFKETGDTLSKLRKQLDKYSLFAGRNMVKMMPGPVK